MTLPDYVQFKPFQSIPINSIFTAATDDLLETLSKMLSLNPLERCTCTEALKMPYFSNKPTPSAGSKLPLPSALQFTRETEESKSNLKRKLSTAEGGTLAKRLVF